MSKGLLILILSSIKNVAVQLQNYVTTTVQLQNYVTTTVQLQNYVTTTVQLQYNLNYRYIILKYNYATLPLIKEHSRQILCSF